MNIRDFSLSAVLAGGLAVFVAFAGPLAVVIQAANTGGLSTELTSSWVWAISFGSGVAGLVLSYKLKVPIIVAWSTPGAALLIVSLPIMGLNQAIGAYIVSGVLVFALGASGALTAFIERIPGGIIAGMLAGVLLSFGTQVFTSIQANPILVVGMLVAFLAAKRLAPRYSTAAAMAVGTVLVLLLDSPDLSQVSLVLAEPVFTKPEWSWNSALGLGVPLAMVTLAGQHVPGLAVLKASGYKSFARPIVAGTGIASVIFAPFGAHAINLSVMAASICTGPESHEDPSKRYVSGIAAGCFYMIVGMFGAALTQLLSSLPEGFLMALAGMALLSSITSSIVAMGSHEDHRDSSVITFLVAASGMTFAGLGAAFWSLVIGGFAYFVLHRKWRFKGRMVAELPASQVGPSSRS